MHRRIKLSVNRGRYRWLPRMASSVQILCGSLTTIAESFSIRQANSSLQIPIGLI